MAAGARASRNPIRTRAVRPGGGRRASARPGAAARWAGGVLLAVFTLASTAAAGIPESSRRKEPISPIPTTRSPAVPQAELGRRLFNDPGLSADGSVSCATCHPLEKGGMDGRVRSAGVGGKPGVINTPTVFNASLQFAQFWDARAVDVRAQIDGPLLDPREMGTSWAAVIAYLEADDRYRASFRKHYPEADGIGPDEVRDAIGSFVETLLTPGAPFDRWLQGEADALTPDQRAGYARFKALGCVACHQGVAVGGNMLQRFGILGDYFVDRGTPIEKADLGHFNVSGDEADRHRFKVPSLRNVALTAPYFHDGSAATLDEAVRVMVKYQLGRTATPEDIRLIVSFLEALTGQWNGHPVGEGPGR